MEKINNLICRKGGEKLLRVSGSIGSEAGVMSIGSGSGVDHILIMATYINQHERTETIWDISNYLRAEIAKIPHVKYLDIDKTEAMNYGVNRSDVTAQIQMMLRSVPVVTFPKENSMDYTVRCGYHKTK